jgi:hypothetical protein
VFQDFPFFPQFVHDRAALVLLMKNDSFTKGGTFWSGLGGPVWAVFAGWTLTALNACKDELMAC